MEKALRRVIELSPDFARAHLELGLLLETGRQRAEAAKELRRALELAPSFVEAHRALGTAALAAHDWPAAASEYIAILAWDQHDAKAQRNLSYALAEQKRERK